MEKSPDKKIKTDTVNLSPRIHGMNFNSYSIRKNIFDIKDSLPIISYLKLYDYETNPKGIDFSKLKDKAVHLKKENIPSVCYYNPKYDLVNNKYVRDIIFSPSKNISKKLQLQKLWRSYDVGSEYKIVDFKK
jgi:hypothetical protein